MIIILFINQNFLFIIKLITFHHKFFRFLSTSSNLKYHNITSDQPHYNLDKFYHLILLFLAHYKNCMAYIFQFENFLCLCNYRIIYILLPIFLLLFYLRSCKLNSNSSNHRLILLKSPNISK